MLNFNSSEKSLGLVSQSHFLYDFSRKMFVMLHSINWLNFIVWLSLILKIMDNTCITTVFSSRCEVIKLKINLIFFIKPFCYMTKKLRLKLKHLDYEKSVWGEIKSNFHHFQWTFSCQKLSQTWECTFNNCCNKNKNNCYSTGRLTLKKNSPGNGLKTILLRLARSYNLSGSWA